MDRSDAHDPIIWPWVAAGALGPFAGRALSRWMGEGPAIGVAFFVTFLCAGLIVRARESTRRPFPGIMAASAVGGVVAGALRYLLG